MENLMFILDNVTCGDNLITVDAVLPTAISTLVDMIMIIIPILVVIFGLLDLGKAVMSQKEDDIKKNQGLLVKRIIIALLVFFVVALVQFVVSLVGGDDANFNSCFDCFINNNCTEVGQ